MKVVTILGTRPEMIKLSLIIKKLDKYFKHIIIHTGQNYDQELYNIFINNFNLKYPDYYLNITGDNPCDKVGKLISGIYKILSTEKPDALLVLGDTNSGLGAYAAKRLKIPVFHMEAGNRSYDENLPEEINRRILDHISDINMCYSENARRNLIREGRRSDHTFVIGSPMQEVIITYKNKIDNSDILDNLNIKKNEFFLLSLHREENIDNNKTFDMLLLSLDVLCDKYKIPIIFSAHPRTVKKLKQRNIKLNKLIQMLKPFGYFDYCKLQLSAKCVLSDSGTLAEESAILNFPAVSLRDSTERQESIDKGTMVIGNLKADMILNSVKISVDSYKYNNKIISCDYIDDNVSMKVIKIIQGYTDIINKVIWNKN